MTLPFERTRAVLEAERFLLNLSDPKVTPGIPKVLRQRAKSILRHFPTQSDLHMNAIQWNNPMVQFVSEPVFGDPNEL